MVYTRLVLDYSIAILVSRMLLVVAVVAASLGLAPGTSACDRPGHDRF